MAERRITGPVNNPGRALLPVPDFTSAEQTVAFDTQLDVAHGLGANPTLVQLVLRCTNLDIGYSAGSEVVVNLAHGTTSDRSYTIFTNSANVSVVQSASINLIDTGTLNTNAITTTSWRWVVRAWL